MNKNIYILFTITIFLISCENNNSRKIVHDKESVETTINSEKITISDLPIQIDSVKYIFHPIGDFKIENNDGIAIYKSSKRRNYKTSNYSNYKVSGNMINLKFQHEESEKITELTNKNIRIQNFTFLKNIYENYNIQLLVYEVVDRDTNRDGELNYNDVKSLYISSIDGKNFKKITKKNRDLIDWKVIVSKNRIYFRTIEDENKDGVFNKNDIIKYKYVNLDSEKFEVKTYKPI
jgi:hypothetical protein